MSGFSRLFRTLRPSALEDWVDDLMHAAVVLGAGTLFTAALRWVWENSTHRKAPTNPSLEGVGWREAIVWSALSGALVGMIKVAVRRGSDKAKARLHESHN